MAETTVSRTDLRRAIGREARLEFFQRYSAGEVLVTGGPDTDVPDSLNVECVDLTQGDSFWVNGWIYFVSDTAGALGVGATGIERPITGFVSDSNKLTVEYPFGVTPKVNAKIEIYDIWPPTAIHRAINKAIRLGGRAFSDIDEDDTTFCVVKDRLRYDLSSMGSPPRRILSVWLEQPSNQLSGRSDSSSATTVEVNAWAGSLTDADTLWWVSIYDGTGKGQTRRVVSVDDDSGTVTVATWKTNPDTTSLLKAWDGDDQINDWLLLGGGRVDQRESPNYFDFIYTYPSYEGNRIRFISQVTPAALDGDTETTVVPEDFIVYKALSNLHDQLVGDNRVDRQLHASMAEYYDALAENFKRDFVRRQPPRTLRKQTSGQGYAPVDNPMGW